MLIKKPSSQRPCFFRKRGEKEKRSKKEKQKTYKGLPFCVKVDSEGFNDVRNDATLYAKEISLSPNPHFSLFPPSGKNISTH